MRNLRFFNILNGSGVSCFSNGTNAVEDIWIVDNQIDTVSNAGIYVAGMVMGTGNTCAPDTYLMNDIHINDNDVTNTNFSSGGNECITIGNGTDGFEILRNHVHDSQQYAIDAKLGAINGEIAYNYCHDLEKHGIYLDPACRVLMNLKVHHNECHDCGSNGIHMSREAARDDDPGAAYPGATIGGAYQWFENVEIFANSCSRCNYGLLMHRHPNDQARLKIFYDGATGTTFNDGETLTGPSGSGRLASHYPLTGTTGYIYLFAVTGTFSNNQVVTGAGVNITVDGTPTWTLAGEIKNVTIAQNTFANNRTQNVALRDFDGATDSQGRVYVGNASDITYGNQITFADGGVDNELTGTPGYASGGNFTTDPGFVAMVAARPNLRITAGSAAHGAGSVSFTPQALGLTPTTDLDGITDFDAVDPSPGCFEA